MGDWRRDFAINFGISAGISVVVSLFIPQLRGTPLWVTVPIFSLPFSIFITLAVRVGLPRVRHRSFLVTVGGQALCFLAAITLGFGTSMWLLIATMEGLNPLDPTYVRRFLEIFVNQGPLLAVGAAYLIALVIGGISQISQKMGPGVLWNWITGRYHEPKEEPRFFLFLDLKDSTALAERLGNLRFSALVRDFFADLTKPVLKTRGEVSHYIGDEAVLTWTMERGARGGACARCFFLFDDAIARRAGYYRERYGIVPEFKAGLHCGPVVATEVGEVKSEIVYHGDVLNTAARIQGATGELGRRFLASAEAVAAMNDAPWTFEPLGEHQFKGKSELVAVVSVERPANHHAQAPKAGK